jgi:hypothetical protein
MNFSEHGDFCRVVRITGPTHNLLGISFSKGTRRAPAVHDLDRNKISQPRLAPDDVSRAVLAGIADANATFGLGLHASEIEFVGSDSPPADIYRFLAFELVRHFREQRKFN